MTTNTDILALRGLLGWPVDRGSPIRMLRPVKGTSMNDTPMELPAGRLGVVQDVYLGIGGDGLTLIVDVPISADDGITVALELEAPRGKDNITGAIEPVDRKVLLGDGPRAVLRALYVENDRCDERMAADAQAPDGDTYNSLYGATHKALLQVLGTDAVLPRHVGDQISAAIEGGSSYWCSNFDLVTPKRETLKSKPWYADPGLYEQEFMIRVRVNEDPASYDLTPERVKFGLAWLAANAPERLEEIVEETGDADTADAFLQACLFGAIVYG